MIHICAHTHTHNTHTHTHTTHTRTHAHAHAHTFLAHATRDCRVATRRWANRCQLATCNPNHMHIRGSSIVGCALDGESAPAAEQQVRQEPGRVFAGICCAWRKTWLSPQTRLFHGFVNGATPRTISKLSVSGHGGLSTRSQVHGLAPTSAFPMDQVCVLDAVGRHGPSHYPNQ